jgi:hypothetical protein
VKERKKKKKKQDYKNGVAFFIDPFVRYFSSEASLFLSHSTIDNESTLLAGTTTTTSNPTTRKLQVLR